MRNDLKQQYKALEGLIDFLPFTLWDPMQKKQILNEIEDRSIYINEIHKARRLKQKSLEVTITIESKMNLI